MTQSRQSIAALLERRLGPWSVPSAPRFLVVGLARTGVAVARLLCEAGISVTVTDVRSESELTEQLDLLRGLGIEFDLGGHSVSTFEKSDVVVVSPGVPARLPQLDAAVSSRARVISELEFGFLLARSPLLAVTGTNGKTTVCEMVGAMLRESGVRAPVGGNIGTPLVELVRMEPDADYYVAEVSSFQLEWVAEFKPRVAALLNVSEDHVDRHPTMSEYRALKARIFRRQSAGDTAVLNAVDELVRDHELPTGVQRLHFGPAGSGVRSGATELDGLLGMNGEAGFTPVIEASQIALPGEHNLENALAAIAICGAVDVDPGAMRRALSRFELSPHRMSRISVEDAVQWIDDSKATNVDATLRAVMSMDSPVVLIAGGLSKGASLARLAELAPRLRAAVLIGTAAAELRDVLGRDVPCIDASSMHEAVQRAKRVAAPGDVVLLSPACASFDMFKDYAHRGRAFREAVEQLIGEGD